MQAALLLLFVAAAAALLLRSKLLRMGLRLLLRSRSARKQYEASPIPGPPAAGSILGHAPAMLSAQGPWIFSAWANKFGPLFKVQLLDHFAVVLTDPDSIARLTRKTGPGPYLPKPHVIYSAIEGPMGTNIVTAGDDAYWRAVRQAAAPCFSMSNLKQVVPLVLELSQRAADHMSSHSCFDVTDAAKRVTSDVMGHLLYGEDLRGVTWEPSDYLDSFNILLKAAAARLSNPLHMLRLWDPEVRLQRRCSARQSAAAAERVRRMRQNPPEPHTIAAHILSALDPATGQPLSERRVMAEVAAFMGAGFETTSHTITWALTLLAAHPDIQDDVFSELQAAGLAAHDDDGSTPGRHFTAADLNCLPLLTAVIKETLRLCGAAPFGGSREVVNEEGADICGYHVPKGTIVMLPTLPFGLAQHNYGSDALTFKPQRWMAAEGQLAADVDTSDDATAAGADSDSSSSSNNPVAPEPAGPGAISDAGLDPVGGVAAAGAVAGVKSGVSAAAGASQQPPEHIAFLTGTRDCIGQNLAKLELQVVLATWLSRFRFSPGPELEQELQVAAATGQPVVAAVHALAGAFVTLQPLSGSMELRMEARRA